MYEVQFNNVSNDWEIVLGDQVYDYGYKTKEDADKEAKQMQFQLDNPQLCRKIIDGSYVD